MHCEVILRCPNALHNPGVASGRIIRMDWSIQQPKCHVRRGWYGDGEKVQKGCDAWPGRNAWVMEGIRITNPNIVLAILPSQPPSSYVGFKHFTNTINPTLLTSRFLGCIPGEHMEYVLFVTELAVAYLGFLPRCLVFAWILVLYGKVRLVSAFLPVFEMPWTWPPSSLLPVTLPWFASHQMLSPQL